MREHLGYAFFKVVIRTGSMLFLMCGTLTLCGLCIVNNINLKVTLLQNEHVIQVLIQYFFGTAVLVT